MYIILHRNIEDQTELRKFFTRIIFNVKISQSMVCPGSTDTRRKLASLAIVKSYMTIGHFCGWEYFASYTCRGIGLSLSAWAVDT